MRKAEDFRHRMKKIATSNPYDAIDLICRFWYYTYAKENELDIGKVDILYALAVREETIKGFLERLDQLPQLIENYRCTDENPVILSTYPTLLKVWNLILSTSWMFMMDAYHIHVGKTHRNRNASTLMKKRDAYSMWESHGQRTNCICSMSTNADQNL